MINKRRIYLFGFATLLLLIPLISMMFSTEVKWDMEDFLLMGILLYGSTFFIDLIFVFVKKRVLRIFFYALILLIFFLIWIELAVGIF